MTAITFKYIYNYRSTQLFTIICMAKERERLKMKLYIWNILRNKRESSPEMFAFETHRKHISNHLTIYSIFISINSLLSKLSSQDSISLRNTYTPMHRISVHPPIAFHRIKAGFVILALHTDFSSNCIARYSKRVDIHQNARALRGEKKTPLNMTWKKKK